MAYNIHEDEEVLSYLKLRDRFKERLRKESRTTLKSSNNDNYGSFFGPSQQTIARRVIQESKQLENPSLEPRVLKSSSSCLPRKKSSSSVALGSKPQVTRFTTKAQILKSSRDYSFLLSDDAEFPAPKDLSVQNLPPPKSGARLAKETPRRIREPQSNRAKNAPDAREIQKPNLLVSHGQASTKKSLTSTKKSLYKGSVSDRPSVAKALPSKNPSVVDAKSAVRKPRLDEPCRVFEDEDDCAPGNISHMIRKIMGYNPDSKKFREREMIDESRMEVGFDDIMKEEKRSARAAKEEDEEEWRKIQEEEEIERRRKAKKHKSSQH